MGPSRSPCGDRLSADPHLRLRLRSLHHCRRAGDAGRPGRVLPTADDPRQAARRCRSEAGVEVREGFTVEEVLIEDGRVVGIKGHSKHGESRPNVLASSSAPMAGTRSWPRRFSPTVTTRSRLLAAYYSYWSGLPMDGRFENYIRDRRGFAVAPTHDGLTMVIVGWPYAEFAENKKDIEETIGRRSGWRRPSPIVCAAPSGRRASSARQYRTISASRTGPAGRWWATRDTTGTSLPAGNHGRLP